MSSEDDIAPIPSAPGENTSDIQEEKWTHGGSGSATIQPFTEKQLLTLYHNDHIRIAQESTDEFLASEQGLCFADCSFTESLNEYLRSRMSLTASEGILQRLIKQLQDEEKEIWTLREEKVENEGVCHDKVKVVTMHHYQVAEFSASAATSTIKTMRQIREELFEQHSLCSYKANKLRTKIDVYLGKICQDIEFNRTQLVTAISILFSFQRKLINEEVFVRDTRSWLDLLARTLLQNSPSFQDRLLLLNHVLRCPAGVGHWASSYIQIPQPQFFEGNSYLSDDALNQMVALLAVLFTSVKGRREMLREHCPPQSPRKSDRSGSNPWVVLDSDGEDENNCDVFPLRENDYVAILNQFPFEALFKYLLKLEKGIEVYDARKFSTTSFFKLFAFGTQFVNLLKSGMQLFSSPSYRQLAKRLGHIIKHTLEYISEHWQHFLTSQKSHPEEMAILDKIEVEYNNFFLRSAKSIFCSSATSGMWQYLAVVPYRLVREDILWYSFALYHFVDDSSLYSMWKRSPHDFSQQIEQKLSGHDFLSSFEDTLSGLPDTEVMFLLTTFANMAIARDYNVSRSFITTVVSELISIGFVNDLTSGSCGKGCRDLISNIARKHPTLLSYLMEKFSQEPHLVESSNNSAALYIARDLDLSEWKPKDRDFDLLGSWLTQQSLDKNYSILSRMIFSKMQWVNAALLPWKRHSDLAILIVQTSAKYAPDTIAGNFLQDSVRHVSNLAGKLRKTPEQVFISWAWEMCSRLRLHRYDRVNDIADIIDLDLDAEHLGEAAATKNPLAAFVALQTSQTGHLVEDVLERGLNQITLVLSSGHYDHVLECLANIVPLFLDQPELLMTSPDFIKIVQQIISVNQTFLKMARDLMVTDFPGPVLKEFVNMIAYQLKNYAAYRRKNPLTISILWISVLSEIPGWMTNKNLMYVMEYCCQAAIATENGHEHLKALFKDIDQKLLDSNQEGFFSWISGSKATTSSYTTPMSEFPWLSFFIMEAEEERTEFLRFYQALVKELSQSHQQLSLDKCYKKILAEGNFPEHAFNLNSLPIYKWCQLILDCPLEQPMQVVFAQKFFKYLTTRQNEDSTSPKLGRCFFEGVINTHYFGRILSKFKTISEFYKKAVIDDATERDKCNIMLAETFQAFVFWIEDDMLILDEKLHVDSCSPKMLPHLLTTVLDSSKRVTFDMIDIPGLDTITDDNEKEWKRLHFRSGSVTRSLTPDTKSNEEFSVRLSSYDLPAPLPTNKFCATSVIVIQVCDNWFCDEKTFENYVNPHLLALLTFSKKFDGQTKQYSSIMCNVNEHARALYINEDTEMWTKASCRGSKGPKGEKFECGGPAAICHKFCAAKLQCLVEQKLHDQQDARATLIDQVILPIEFGVIAASSIVDECVEYIMKMYFRHLSLCPGQSHSPALIHYHRLGVALFYRLCDQFGEEANACPLVRHLLTSSLERLGQAMIQDNPQQCQPLLDRICRMPDYAQFLTAVFTPGCSERRIFLEMYHTINNMKESYSTLSFTLLSKMTVDAWTKAAGSDSDLNAISRLISVLGDSLKRTGQKVNPERQILHDLHRQHLIAVLKNNAESHYEEIISLLIVLSDAEVLHPTVWIDVVNAHLPSGTKRLSCPMSIQDLRIACRLFASSQLVDKESVENVQKMFKTHFNKERRSVGLHGLYSKYRSYTFPIATYNGLLCGSYIRAASTNNQQDVGLIFEWILSVFEPWIVPLMEDQRQETAAWIQQFAEANKVLFPWAPGDAKEAELMMSVFSTCLLMLEELLPTNQKSCLSYLLEMYCQRFARPAIKDFVLHIVHTHWLDLPWEQLTPRLEDMTRLVAVLDAFIPLCHEFLGKIFCRLPWKTVLHSDETSKACASFLIHIVVKLSAEPQVRQSGTLMKLLSQDVPEAMWKWVNTTVFNNLMHWYVMSVDAKVVLIEGSHPLDVKILSLLRASSQIDDIEASKELTFEKSRTFLKCMIRLLSSCGSKHKNYVSQHENELEKSMREMVDDLGDVIISCHHQRLKECEDLVKNFLALLNSNSVIPKHAMQSISDCWLRMTDFQMSLIFLTILLGQASQLVSCPSMLSDLFEDCLEAYFRDHGDYQQTNNVTSWTQIVSYVIWPKDKEKLTQCLVRAVEKGHILVLYASLQFTKKQCVSITDEQVKLVSTILDWFRHLRVDEKSEPKLPLLFREYISLVLRQLSCGASEPIVSQMLLDFVDVLSPLLGLSGQSWTILGVLGFSSKYNPPPRAKFLALSITYFIYSCVLEGPSLKTRAKSDRLVCLNTEKVSSIEKELEVMLSKQAYFGLIDNIEWVLKMTRDPSRSLEDLEHFFMVMIRDNLYTEHWLH